MSIWQRHWQVHEGLEGDGDKVADGADDGVLELALESASNDRVVAREVLLPEPKTP